MRHKIKEMCMLYTPYKEYIVGIGECGIDTFQEGSEVTLDIQKDLFTQQCDLARQR
jgi:Tat protein secretion system quality control protein TatD with DNase activity